MSEELVQYPKTPEYLLVATLCIRCYPKKESAVYIYSGCSLCEEHFKEELTYMKGETDETS